MTDCGELYERAKKLIPGGTQLLSKRPEMFLPSGWPAYYERARGVEITTTDGRVLTDMSMMGIGACILGYADPEVDEAVRGAIGRGVASTLNAPEEVELGELLCELHPWAEMVRYARGGGEAMSVAIRIARAASGRDAIAFCGYHGWTDWYLAANLSRGEALDSHLLPGLEPAGVPKGLSGTSMPFRYNDLEALREIVAATSGSLAAVVLEPQRDTPPQPGFLESVRAICDEIGAVLVFDEITAGFRMTTGGIHLLLGVEPDIAVFAKGLANGYAMSAIIGRESVMQAAQSSFISSTNWTERIGPVAALATIRKHKRESVADHICWIGQKVADAWQQAATNSGLAVEIGGLPSLAHFVIKHDTDLSARTLFTQEMLARGFLAFSQFKPSFSHSESHVTAYTESLERAFSVVADAVANGRLGELLQGPPAHAGFHRLT